MTDDPTTFFEETPEERAAALAAHDAARNSYHGRGLTHRQFHNAWTLSGILHDTIHHTGSFKQALTDYARAYAGPEPFDALHSEAVLRDIYKGRYGQTLNTTRETLLENAKNLPEYAQQSVLNQAEDTLTGIEETNIPFYKSFDISAFLIASEFDISEIQAKTLMKKAYEAEHGQELYVHGKQTEAKYYKPERQKEQVTTQPKETQQKQQ